MNGSILDGVELVALVIVCVWIIYSRRPRQPSNVTTRLKDWVERD